MKSLQKRCISITAPLPALARAGRAYSFVPLSAWSQSGGDYVADP